MSDKAIVTNEQAENLTIEVYEILSWLYRETKEDPTATQNVKRLDDAFCALWERRQHDSVRISVMAGTIAKKDKTIQEYAAENVRLQEVVSEIHSEAKKRLTKQTKEAYRRGQQDGASAQVTWNRR